MQVSPDNDAIVVTKNKFGEETRVKLDLIFQFIEQILFELNHILQSLAINVILPAFDYNKLCIKYDEIVETFKQNMDIWVNKKVNDGEKDCFTKHSCKQYAQQRWQEEGELFTACFSAMINYLQSVCGNIERRNIQLLLLERFTLMMSKMKHSFSKYSTAFLIFRGKVMVNCTKCHRVLDRAHPKLFISEWIGYRQQMVTQETTADGNAKRVINSKECHDKLVELIERLYYERYHSIPESIRQCVGNVLCFNGKNVIVCDCLEVQNGMNNEKEDTLEYFGQNADNRNQTLTVVPEQETLFPNFSPFTFPFNVNDSPPFINCGCEVRINELKEENERLRDKVKVQHELQRRNRALQNKIKELNHRMNAMQMCIYDQHQFIYNIQYNKYRQFQSVHHYGVHRIRNNAQAKANREKRVDLLVDTLSYGRNKVNHNAII